MLLRLADLPAGLAGPNDATYNGKVPTRARFLFPEAAQSLCGLEAASGGLVYTDVFRSADASLAACRNKRGCQRPAFSAHNFGLAFDLDLDATKKKLQLTYQGLTSLLNRFGWYCHRRDGNPDEMESWHFNFLGEQAGTYLTLATEVHKTWSAPVETRIAELYGADFLLTPVQLQQALEQAHFYYGAIDGLQGPLTYEAIRAFQRAWQIEESPVKPGGTTHRTLAYVTADRVIEPKEAGLNV